MRAAGMHATLGLPSIPLDSYLYLLYTIGLTLVDPNQAGAARAYTSRKSWLQRIRFRRRLDKEVEFVEDRSPTGESPLHGKLGHCSGKKVFSSQ